jgi:hypothetical protein
MCIKAIGVRWVFMGPAARRVVLVVVSLVRRMTVTIVNVVDMVAVLDRGMAAVGAVLVLVPFGLEVPPARDPTPQGAV